MRPAVYRIQIEPPEAKLDVTGTSVSIEGEGSSRTLTVAEADGHREVVLLATLHGYENLERVLTPHPGESETLQLCLQRLADSPDANAIAEHAEAAPAVAPLKIRSIPPQTIEVGKPSLEKEITLDLRGKGVTLGLVLIPAGEFLMGSPDSDKDASPNEKPQHQVRITKPFYLGKYLVTQEQWESVMGSNPSYFRGPKNPVEQVSWKDCQEFVEKLNAKVATGSFRCPTRPSGNMRAGRGVRRCIPLETRNRGWANTRGVTLTLATRRILLARRIRTPGGSTDMNAGTCGNGVRTGTPRLLHELADERSEWSYNRLAPRVSRR